MSGIIGVSPDMKSGVVGAWPAGHVLQVVEGLDTGTFTAANTNNNPDTSHTVTITPHTANAKIYVQLIGGTYGNLGDTSGAYAVQVAVKEGTTDINCRCVETHTSNSRIRVPIACGVVYSPSYTLGGSLTYNVYYMADHSIGIYSFGSRSLIVMEIKS
jgi:hypothetical protein